MNTDIEIYCDGSCNNKTGMNGGIGIVIIENKIVQKISIGQFVNTTSAQMEILALLISLISIKDKSKTIKIYCDNQYVVYSLMKGWVYNWENDN